MCIPLLFRYIYMYVYIYIPLLLLRYIPNLSTICHGTARHDPTPAVQGEFGRFAETFRLPKDAPPPRFHSAAPVILGNARSTKPFGYEYSMKLLIIYTVHYIYT